MTSSYPPKRQDSSALYGDEFTKGQIKEIKKTFRMFDKDGDGKITKDELNKVMKMCGHDPSDQDLEDMIAMADKSGSGMIGYDEFVAIMIARKHFEKEMPQDVMAAFEMFDKDSDGYITPEELLMVMTQLGEEISRKEAVEMMGEADLNGDGRIDYREFTQMMFGGMK